ncbi:hypothetical protein NEOLI_004835 [Neolecta irregularis DAH-3]|uniref:Uncharacterized protein n=1 Tax=Neolecta irregularis (strain DAH-3) TaxID=1198029 RepID=A0A1U7LIF5_NEOID|nr:hypothetical protein NEOLI_004835 [Neolecta irregularis DAH-3]|eukprot:OLL22311.1 hypothetical protein NEOLI_004835 [Neolecta irregularis DAH-3]
MNYDPAESHSESPTESNQHTLGSPPGSPTVSSQQVVGSLSTQQTLGSLGSQQTLGSPPGSPSSTQQTLGSQSNQQTPTGPTYRSPTALYNQSTAPYNQSTAPYNQSTAPVYKHTTTAPSIESNPQTPTGPTHQVDNGLGITTSFSGAALSREDSVLSRYSRSSSSYNDNLPETLSSPTETEYVPPRQGPAYRRTATQQAPPAWSPSRNSAGYGPSVDF